MKEAAGEANMTVVTIVLIAIVLGAGTLIVTNMVKNITGKTSNKQIKCTQLGGAWDGSKCNCLDGTTTRVTKTTGISCDGRTVYFK